MYAARPASGLSALQRERHALGISPNGAERQMRAGKNKKLKANSKKSLPKQRALEYNIFRAEVVELVDTLGSGSSSRKGVGVRVSPSAPTRSPK